MKLELTDLEKSLIDNENLKLCLEDVFEWNEKVGLEFIKLIRNKVDKETQELILKSISGSQPDNEGINNEHNFLPMPFFDFFKKSKDFEILTFYDAIIRKELKPSIIIIQTPNPKELYDDALKKNFALIKGDKIIQKVFVKK